MTPPPESSGFDEAIRLTTHTIQVRAMHYRNFVISVVSIAFMSMVWASITLSWRPLLGLLVLVPLCGIFLALDTSTVHRWRHQVLEMWIHDRLDLAIFTHAMTTIGPLPSHTLHGMLSTLPFTGHGLAGRPLSPATRRGLALTVQTLNCCQYDRTAWVTLAAAAGLTCLVWALVHWSWRPLVGGLGVVPVIALGTWCPGARFRRWQHRLYELHHKHGLEIKDFLEIASRLEWDAVPDKKKDKLLLSLMEFNMER